MIGTFWFVRLDEGELWKNDYRLQSRVSRVKSRLLIPRTRVCNDRRHYYDQLVVIA